MNTGAGLARRATSTATGAAVLGIVIGYLRHNGLLMALFAVVAVGMAVLRGLPPVRRGEP